VKGTGDAKVSVKTAMTALPSGSLKAGIYTVVAKLIDTKTSA
jgi:hypothetical protein